MGLHKQMTGKIGPGSAPKDVYLKDYIERKAEGQAYVEPPKLTFKEWMAKQFEGVYGYDKERPEDFILWGMPGRLVHVIWKAAQENK